MSFLAREQKWDKCLLKEGEIVSVVNIQYIPLLSTLLFVSTLPEYVVVETTEHKCLQSQFSVLYNEAMQLKTQLEENRCALFLVYKRVHVYIVHCTSIQYVHNNNICIFIIRTKKCFFYNWIHMTVPFTNAVIKSEN